MDSRFQELESIQKSLMAMIVAGVGLTLVSIVAISLSLAERSAIIDWFSAPDGTPIELRALAEFTAAKGRSTAAMGWGSLASVALVITLMLYSYRAINLAKHHQASTSWTPARAAWVWFIPLVNVILAPAVLGLARGVVRAKRRPILGDIRTDQFDSRHGVLAVTTGASLVFGFLAAAHATSFGTQAEFITPVHWRIAALTCTALTGVIVTWYSITVRTEADTIRRVVDDPLIWPVAWPQMRNEAASCTEALDVLTTNRSVVEGRAACWFAADRPDGRLCVVVGLLPQNSQLRRSEARWLNWTIFAHNQTLYHYGAPPRIGAGGTLHLGKELTLCNPRPAGALETVAVLFAIALPGPAVPSAPLQNQSQPPEVAPASPALGADIRTRLTTARSLYDDGLMTEREYEESRANILRDL